MINLNSKFEKCKGEVKGTFFNKAKMFDVRFVVRSKFDCCKMNTFVSVRCSTTDVLVCLMFDKMVFDPSLTIYNYYCQKLIKRIGIRKPFFVNPYLYIHILCRGEVHFTHAQYFP